MKWILILMVFAGNGVAATSAVFDDQVACEDAATAMRQNAKRSHGTEAEQPIISYTCSPTSK
jgi:hypothetical protein